MTDDLYNIRVLVPSDVPDDYKKHALEHARRQAGNNIYELLHKRRNPCVIKIDDEVRAKQPSYGWERLEDEIRITLSLTDVQYKDVTIATCHDFPSFSKIPARAPKWLAWLNKKFAK